MRFARPTLDGFARRLEAQGDLASTAERPLLAVSGGPDSLALLLMMAELRPGRLAAATVDHGLRPEAAAEAAMVAALCATRNVPHAIVRPARSLHPLAALEGQQFVVGGRVDTLMLPDGSPSGLQARARETRYDALIAHAHADGCDVVFTAHHLDDQAETFLMRASRGSGVGGLAGVRRSTTWRGFPVYRPLLDWERRQLADVLRAADATAVDDPSNGDPAYDRTRYRALLASSPDLKAAGLARSAAALADASEALDWTAAIVARRRLERAGDTMLVSAVDLPRELQRRVLAIALDDMGEREPRGPALDGVLRALAAGGRTSLGNILLERRDGHWALWPAPPRRAV